MRSKLAIMLLLFCSVSVSQPGVSVVGFSESRHAFAAFSPNGEVTLPVARRQLDIEFPGGTKRKERGDLMVVYDPATGHYFWRYAPQPKGAETATFLSGLQDGAERVFAEPEELVDFYIPGALYAQAHTERAKSLEAAEEASTEDIRRQVARPGTTAIGMAATDVRATSKTTYIDITSDWACPQAGQPGWGANCTTWNPSILSISHDGGLWRLVIRNRWDLEQVLDSQFHIVSERRLPDAAGVKP
jgi:hypothetical protein